MIRLDQNIASYKVKDERIRTEDHEIHIHNDGAEFPDWSVWLNPQELDFSGVCIGTGKTRDEAIDDAVAILKKTLDTLNTPRHLLNRQLEEAAK